MLQCCIGAAALRLFDALRKKRRGSVELVMRHFPVFGSLVIFSLFHLIFAQFGSFSFQLSFSLY